MPMPSPTCRDCSLIEGTQVTLLYAARQYEWVVKLAGGDEEDVQRQKRRRSLVSDMDADEGCRGHGKHDAL